MGIKQQQVGKSWEQEIMEYYHNKGYFTYKFPTEFNGTVCDILVSRNANCIYIEAKHTTTDKLYFKGCGIYKKKDELDHFIAHSNNNIYIYIKSDKLGTFWTTWIEAKAIFENKGYLDLEKDCYKMEMR